MRKASLCSQQHLVISRGVGFDPAEKYTGSDTVEYCREGAVKGISVDVNAPGALRDCLAKGKAIR